MHAWLAKYAAGGLEGLADGSQRPRSCPHQMPGDFEALVAEMRRRHVGWGPRRIAYELARQAVDPAPSESAVYRCLVPLGLVEPDSTPGVDAGSGSGGSGPHAAHSSTHQRCQSRRETRAHHRVRQREHQRA